MTDDEISRLQAEHLRLPDSEEMRSLQAAHDGKYYQAGKFHGLSDVPEHDPDKAHALIVEAFKRPATLPGNVFSFDKRSPEHQGRGRPIMRSRYDNFIEKLKGILYKQTRLPFLRQGTKRQKVHEAPALLDAVKREAVLLRANRLRVTAIAIRERLIFQKINVRTDLKIIRQAIKKLRQDGIIPK